MSKEREEEMRFSDEKLEQLSVDFKKHTDDYQMHTQEYHEYLVKCEHRYNNIKALLEKNNALLSGINVLDLKLDFEQNKIDQERKWSEFSAMINSNTEANLKIAESLQRLEKNTEGVVKLFDDWKGTVRIGTSAQHFGLWLAKWGVIGAGLAAIWAWGLRFITETFK